MKRAIGLARTDWQHRVSETSIAQPVEIDWSIGVGGKKEGIHRRFNAVASVDISRHALWPSDQLVAEELAHVGAGWFSHRSQPLRQRSTLSHAHFCRPYRQRVPGDRRSYSFSA